MIGLLPITGLPLPFISDGGSALVVDAGAVGVLASFARAEPDAARALHARPPDKWVRLLWAPLPPLPRDAAPAPGPTADLRSRERRPRRRAASGSGATRRHRARRYRRELVDAVRQRRPQRGARPGRRTLDRQPADGGERRR